MRRIAIALGAGATLLGVLAIAAVVWRVELAGAVLRTVLARSGFPDARFRVERADLRAIEVASVEAGARLRADRVEVTLDLRRLPSAPVERVRVIGARVDLAAESAAPATEPAAGGPGGLPPLGLLPVLELEGAVVETPSPVGPVVLRLDSRVAPEGAAVAMTLRGEIDNRAVKAVLRAAARLDEAGAVSISMDVDSLAVDDPRVRIAKGTAALALHGRSTGLDLQAATGSLGATLEGVAGGGETIGAVTAKAPFELERTEAGWALRLIDASVALPGLALDVASVSGTISTEGADLALGRVTDRAQARRFEPLAIRLRATRTEPLEFASTVSAAAGRATMQIEGTYDRAKGEARAAVRWPRLELDPARVRPTDLSPLLAFDGTVTGAVEGVANLRWTSRRGLDGNAAVTIDGVSFETGGIRADRVDGKIELASLLPPTTATMQGLRIRELHTGVTLTDTVFLFRLEPAAHGRGSRLRIERFLTGFAGGRIVVEGALLDPAATENGMTFRLEDVDVARLFELVAIEGVSGSGRIAGTIPITVKRDAVAIPEGKLSGGTGVLQVRSETTANLLAGGGRSAELLLEALRDFHYEQLTMSIAKSYDGEATVRLHLRGNNPAVLDGRAFRVNVNLTGNVDRLVRALLEVARLSDKAVRATVGAAREESR